MDRYPIAGSSLEKYYYINGKLFERQYKEHLSDYTAWKDSEAGVHAEEYLVFPENMGESLSIDETSLSDGELYTIVTNKAAHGRKGCLVAIIRGTKAEDVYKALRLIPRESRAAVREITLDLSSSMRVIATKAFPSAIQVIDRFHVQKLALDALQEMRIGFRWSTIEEENKFHEREKEARQAAKDRGYGLTEKEKAEFIIPTYGNGDTKRQLLARSRYLLFKSREKWTASQKARAHILFSLYPDIEIAYNLTDELRRVYSMSKTADGARLKLALWYNRVEKAGYESFKVIKQTIQDHYNDIVTFFNNRSTNASAESFNAKIKNFRAQLRGVSDVKYFLFRLSKIYA